jgi:hypothetical protein
MKNDIASKIWNLVIAEQYIYNTSGNVFDYYDSGLEKVPVQK